MIVTATNHVGSTKATSAQVGKVLTTSQVKTLLLNALNARGKGARIGALLKSGRYAFSFSPPGSGRLATSWTSTTKGKRLVVATLTVSFQGTRARTVKIVLSAKGKQALKGAKHLKLTWAGTLYLPGGAPIGASRTITLNR